MRLRLGAGSYLFTTCLWSLLELGSVLETPPAQALEPSGMQPTGGVLRHADLLASVEEGLFVPVVPSEQVLLPLPKVAHRLSKGVTQMESMNSVRLLLVRDG
jgi:hypothetical protein